MVYTAHFQEFGERCTIKNWSEERAMMKKEGRERRGHHALQ